MSTTYLEAVNEILSETNEVLLTESSFGNAVGVQNYVKIAVRRAYAETCGEEEEWPFLAPIIPMPGGDNYSGNSSVDTVAGTRWYLLKPSSTSVETDYGKVDWDSFYLTDEAEIFQTLNFRTFDDWRDHRRDNENSDDALSQEYGIPDTIIESNDGRSFGLSPIPKGIYSVNFTAWKQAAKLTLWDDPILIPFTYLPVMQHRARYYVHFFKKDYQEATLANSAYEKGLRKMRRGLIGQQQDYMRDDRTGRA